MKTKTMYVCKADLGNYKNFIVSEVKEGRMNFEVQISWQEPEREVTIKESKLGEIIGEYPLDTNEVSSLIEKLFGAEK